MERTCGVCRGERSLQIFHALPSALGDPRNDRRCAYVDLSDAINLQ